MEQLNKTELRDCLKEALVGVFRFGVFVGEGIRVYPELIPQKDAIELLAISRTHFNKLEEEGIINSCHYVLKNSKNKLYKSKELFALKMDNIVENALRKMKTA